MAVEKLLVMSVAAQLTEAACGSIGANLPVSADLKDPNVRLKNLQVWETFRSYYIACGQVLVDDTNWPPPNVAVGTTLIPSILNSAIPVLTGLLKGTPLAGLATLLPQLLGALTPPPSPPVTTPVPDPGSAPIQARS